MTLDKYNLINFSKEELITLVNQLLNKLTEKERLEFVSKWISSQEALEEAGAGNTSSFIEKVEYFCKECLDGKYFIESDYEQYYDYYDYEETYDYSESEWAKKFSTQLKFSVMYSRNKNYDFSYIALDKLLDCLHEAEFDEEILGTENPMEYIDIDWNEVFEEYYISMINQISDRRQAANKAVEVWMNFGEQCTDIILKNFDDVTYIEESIRRNIADNFDCWSIQHQLYELLKSFYLKIGLEFDEIVFAEGLVCYNSNFLKDKAQGYMNRKMWDEALQIIQEALEQVTDEQVILDLNSKMVDCYESLNMFNEAYNAAVKMFKKHNSHELYLRARTFAVKIGSLSSYIESMEKYFQTNKRYDSIENLLRILSFEGYSIKLIDTALKTDGYLHHDYLKYTIKSLIYHALSSKNVMLPNLQEFIQSIESNKISGIVDMIITSEDTEDEDFLLNNAIDILKRIVQFHIDAAQRSRYARAAYYCAVIMDVYVYMNKEAEFNQYHKKILTENNRRPALKDEMKKKIW